MAPAPHVDGDPSRGLARSRRPGASAGRLSAALSVCADPRWRHTDARTRTTARRPELAARLRFASDVSLGPVRGEGGTVVLRA